MKKRKREKRKRDSLQKNEMEFPVFFVCMSVTSVTCYFNMFLFESRSDDNVRANLF